MPFLGAFLEAGEVVGSAFEVGDAINESSDILTAIDSTVEKFEISGTTSIELPIDPDINDIPLSLTEGVRSEFNGAFEEHIMGFEKLDSSNFNAFVTNAIQRTGDMEALASLIADENATGFYNLYVSFIEFGIEYYEYHKTRIALPSEDNSVSDKLE